jgi:hypothetical protein
MLVTELSQNQEIDNTELTNSAPFVVQLTFLKYQTADYWIEIFNAPDGSYNINAILVSLIESLINNYTLALSYNDCVAQESSYYYSLEMAVLYIHHDHDIDPYVATFEVGTAIGFTEKDVIYIDGVEYLPLLESIPSIAKKQDLLNYNELALVTGNAVHRNTGGKMDFLINAYLYGNDYKIYYLDNQIGIQDYTRSDLIGIHCAYIDDYEISLQKAVFTLGDKRDSQNIDIPVDKFNITDYPDIDDNYIDSIIPVAWGLIRRSTAIPIDSEAIGTVTFRQALLLTSLGTVQVKIDEAWVTKVPVSTDLLTGSFTLAQADGRNASGVPYECRVYGSVGISVTYASDIIKDMNERFLGIEYLVSNYDTTEWESEEVQLETVGLLLDEQTKMYTAIALIQNGANVGFRYDILPNGKRTIRIDDHDRAVSDNIHQEDIFNVLELPVGSDKNQLAGIVEVEYSKDYNADKYLSVTDDTEQENVLQKYRKIPTLTNKTLLTTEAHAQEKASWLVSRTKDIPKLPDIIVHGKRWRNIRIFDIVKIALTPGENDFATSRIISGRKYYGFWKASIVGIDPDIQNIQNRLTLQLISEYDPVTAILIGEEADGSITILVSETDAKIIAQ